MSEGVKTAEEKAAESRRGPRAQRGPGMHMAMPTEKSQNFGAGAKRLLGLLRPQRAPLTGVLALAVTSVGLSALGPKLLGSATDLIFAGAIGRQLPAGASTDQVVAGLRAAGHDTQADLIANMKHLVPGEGIDFAAVGRVLALVLVMYLAAACCCSGWWAGSSRAQ